MKGPRVDSYSKTARIPRIGSRWVWEIDSDASRELIEVVEVKWNGEEWWVKTLGMAAKARHLPGLTEPGEGAHWNDLGRFAEAVTPVGAEEHWRNPPRDEGTEG
jgi:hypothetical protein